MSHLRIAPSPCSRCLGSTTLPERVSPSAAHFGGVQGWHPLVYPTRDCYSPSKGPGHLPWSLPGESAPCSLCQRLMLPSISPCPRSGSGDSFVLLPSILGRVIHFGSFVLHISSLGRMGKGDQLSPPLPLWRSRALHVLPVSEQGACTTVPAYVSHPLCKVLDLWDGSV